MEESQLECECEASRRDFSPPGTNLVLKRGHLQDEQKIYRERGLFSFDRGLYK